MIKVLLVATVAVVGTASFASVNAQTTYRKKTIAANGRCGGVSYGTGARRCGTRSGGPVGGNASRN